MLIVILDSGLLSMEYSPIESSQSLHNRWQELSDGNCPRQRSGRCVGQPALPRTIKYE